MEALNKRLSREESGKIKMTRNASTIVSEILNDSALSSVLDNSQNLASTSTTPNTTVEEEVRRLFRPGSVRNDSNVIYQHENLCENGMNQLTSVQRQISQHSQSQTMLASTEVQANGFSRPVTNSQLIRRNETSQTPNQLQDDFVNNLGQVNQQSETMGCNRNLTSYVPRRFNFTRNGGKRNCKAKASNVKGNSCFYEEIVLLTGPNDTVTPRQLGTKLYLKRNKQIVRGVQFSKQWSEDQVTQQVKSLFGSKLSECSFEFLESVYTDLVPPTLPPGESFNGMMFYTTFRDKIVYVRPQDQVIPPPPKVARSKKSKKTASVFEETLHDSDDSTISEFGTERSADEENEILQAKGLSTVENSSNTVVDVISDPSISESLVSQNSNSSNTNTEQEIPPVIDLTSDYEYAAMFDEQLDEILCDEDETNIFPTSSEHEQEGLDPQPTAEEILRNLATIINFDEISKFNISRSNVWESALRGFNRKSFSPTKKISVKFMDDIGQPEGAIDAGGPRREF